MCKKPKGPIWGSDEFPIVGTTYQFKSPILTGSDVCDCNHHIKPSTHAKRKFIEGKLIEKINEKCTFVSSDRGGKKFIYTIVI